MDNQKTASIWTHIKHNNWVLFVIGLICFLFIMWRLDNMQKDFNMKVDYMGIKGEINLTDPKTIEKGDTKGATTPSGTLYDIVKPVTNSAQIKRGVNKNL